MEKPLHPDYLYIDSEELKQRVAFHKETGWLFCQDKYPDGNLVSYSPSELEILGRSGGIISMLVHRIKREFTGTVVDYVPKKIIEERTHSTGKLPDTTKEKPTKRKNGESKTDTQLDIFGYTGWEHE